MKLSIKFFLFAVCLVNLISCTQNTGEITMGSLLNEMVSREKLAQYPDPYYETRQFSSYDISSTEKGVSEWYANWDRSQFIRTDSIEGRREFVVFDAEGPGAIVRFWVTVADYSDKGILRFYIDHSSVPIIEGEVLSIIGGSVLAGAPLSESVSSLTPYKERGHNLYLPIPYNKHCKVTYESPSVIEPGKNSVECFYYNINYRTYEKGTKVKSFTMSDLEKYAGEIKNCGNVLLSMPESVDMYNKTTSEQVDLSQNNNKLVLNQGGAIRRLSVKLQTEDLPQALRSTILKIKFDDTDAVWVPVGDFFGTGNRLSPYKTFYTQVTNDSVFTCYWVMPYKNTCEITLENLRKDIPVIASLEVCNSPWKWDDHSMYFGAGWTEFHKLYTGKTRSMEGTTEQFDVNFVFLYGKGVYVGDALTLFNSVGDWWGEGDEKIYIDGESFPSHFGTGTEDYYGYAWCMHNFFEHPFIAQPDGSGATQPGHVSNVRFRGLDAIPFTKSLVFDMEVWHWASTYINFAPATFWYMLPGGRVNRKAEPKQAMLPVAMHKNDLVDNFPNTSGLIEGEFLDITLTGGIEKSQTIPWMDWSNEAQFFWRDAQAGDKAILKFTVDKTGTYDVSLKYTVAPDYGHFSVSLNGKLLQSSLDTYADKLAVRSADFRQVVLKKGENELTFIQLHKNERSTNNFLGIDCILINNRE